MVCFPPSSSSTHHPWASPMHWVSVAVRQWRLHRSQSEVWQEVRLQRRNGWVWLWWVLWEYISVELMLWYYWISITSFFHFLFCPGILPCMFAWGGGFPSTPLSFLLFECLVLKMAANILLFTPLFHPVATTPEPRPCTDTEWQCGNRECIDRSLRCDRKYHCADGTDEFDCGGWTPAGNKHPPPPGHSWPSALVHRANLLYTVSRFLKVSVGVTTAVHLRVNARRLLCHSPCSLHPSVSFWEKGCVYGLSISLCKYRLIELDYAPDNYFEPGDYGNMWCLHQHLKLS